MFFLVKWL